MSTLTRRELLGGAMAFAIAHNLIEPAFAQSAPGTPVSQDGEIAFNPINNPPITQEDLKPKNWRPLTISISSSFAEDDVPQLRDMQRLIYPPGEVATLNEVLFYAPEQVPIVFTTMFHNPNARLIPGFSNVYLRNEALFLQEITDLDSPFQVDERRNIDLLLSLQDQEWLGQNGKEIRRRLADSEPARLIGASVASPLFDTPVLARPGSNSSYALVVGQGAVYAGEDLTNYPVFVRARINFKR